MGKHSLEVLRFRRRKSLAVFLVLAMVAVGLIPLLYVTNSGQLVRLEEADLDQLDSKTPISLTIADPLWGEVYIYEYSEMSEITQLMRSLPVAAGAFPGEGLDKLSGYFTYPDGMTRIFSITTVLRVGDQVFYSETAQERLQSIKKRLEERFYTVSRLSSLLNPEHHVFLFNGTDSMELAPEALAGITAALQVGEIVEDREEAALTVSDRKPRYTLFVREERGVDLIILQVYSNESTLVFDKQSGLKYMMCFSSKLNDICKLLLEPVAEAGGSDQTRHDTF